MRVPSGFWDINFHKCIKNVDSGEIKREIYISRSGVVPHRGNPEGLIPGARKTNGGCNGINYAACSLQLFMMGLNDY